MVTVTGCFPFVHVNKKNCPTAEYDRGGLVCVAATWTVAVEAGRRAIMAVTGTPAPTPAPVDDDQPRTIVAPVAFGDRVFRGLLRGAGLAVLAMKIGRASCRERGMIAGTPVCVEKKT